MSTRVRAELYGIGLRWKCIPPITPANFRRAREIVTAIFLTHWCELPVELAALNYLGGSKEGPAANARPRGRFSIPITPTNTPRPARNCSMAVRRAPYRLWVPTNFPSPISAAVPASITPTSTSVPCGGSYGVWGRKPKSPKTLSSYAPMSSDTWYPPAPATAASLLVTPIEMEPNLARPINR